MSTPLQSSISKIRREITDQLDALENLATSKAKALETAEQRYLELERERDGLKAQLANQATVPRVITADELREGQEVAFRPNLASGWDSGHVDEGHRVRLVSWRRNMPADYAHTIVLLQDAPAKEPEPVKVGDEINTEEELEKLPYGTILRAPEGDAFEMNLRGWCSTGTEEPMSSWVIIDYAPFTVLYLPKEDA